MGILIFLGLAALSVYLFVSAAAACVHRAHDRKNVETNLGELELPLIYPLKSRLIGDGSLLIFRDGNGKEKTIPIASIQSAQFQVIKARCVGIITLTLPKSPTGGFSVGGIMATVENGEETFSFGDEYMAQGQSLYNHIQTTLSSQGSTPRNAPPVNTTPALTDELLKLKSLLDAGALTEDEFQRSKEKLLK